jgi:hypothetical protein
LKGYEVHKTLLGHGLEVVTVQGEDIDALWAAFARVVTHQGPAASESHCPLLPFIVCADACKQSCPSASWLRVCLRSREPHTVMT